MMFDRRSILGGMAGLVAALMHPGLSSAKPLPRLPRLRPGDRVGLVAPASSDDEPLHLEAALSTVRGMGLVPVSGAHISDKYGYLSGTDEARASDLNAMFANEDVRAIFVIRGGWGSARLLPLLDWDIIRANPKLLVGYSDATALHLAFAARAGFPTLHAPNAGDYWGAVSWESFWRLAFAGEAPILGFGGGRSDASTVSPTITIHPGKASGRLLGGNLTVLSTLMGTPWLPDFEDAILFLEDVGEAEYRIDRMMNQLALSGILDRLAGVVFGQCTYCQIDVTDYSGFTVPDILRQYLAPLRIPAASGAIIGHIGNQLSLPVGAEVEMDADAGTIRLLRPIV